MFLWQLVKIKINPNKSIYLPHFFFIASGIILVISSQFLISFWLVFIAVHSTFRKRSIKGTISSFVDRLKGRDVQQGVGIVLEEMQQSLDDEFEHTEQQKQQESRKKSKQENK